MRFAKLQMGLIASALLAAAQLLPPINLVVDKVPADSSQFKLIVKGMKFKAAMHVLWNGQPRQTEFVDEYTLKAVITQDDLAMPALAKVSVYDDELSAVASAEAAFAIYLPLVNNDLIYDPLRQRIYVSVSQNDVNGPSIAVYDPDGNTVDRYIPLTEEPGRLALSDDSRYLYIQLDQSSDHRLRRMDLTGVQADLDITLLQAGNLVPVMGFGPVPGQGASVVVQFGATLEIVDNASPRPTSGGGNQCLIGVPDDSTFLTASFDNLLAIKFSVGGIVFPLSFSPATYVGVSACPVYATGRVYSQTGDVVDVSSPSPVQAGKFAASGMVGAAPEINRVYFIASDLTPTLGPGAPGSQARLLVFDSQTRDLLETVALPTIVSVNQRNERLLHWGTDGIAFSEAEISSGQSRWIFLFHVPPPQ